MRQRGRWPDAPGGGKSFVGALREQLGLKRVPKRAPVEVIVVDKVERPTAN